MSRGLGQTELLEVAPSRRLLVRPEHVNWWGVDPSTWRVALATIDAEGRRGVTVASFSRRGIGGERLADIWRVTATLARETALMLPPGVIVIEQPSGKQANPELSYATGAIMGALFAGVCRATDVAVVVETVPSSRWKAVACGNGALYKPRRERGRPPPAPEEYGVLRWARTEGYTGSSWDDADAMGVAEYARRTFCLEER